MLDERSPESAMSEDKGCRMIRLLIVADIRLYRERLAQILGRDERLAVVDGVAERRAAPPSYRSHQEH